MASDGSKRFCSFSFREPAFPSNARPNKTTTNPTLMNIFCNAFVTMTQYMPRANALKAARLMDVKNKQWQHSTQCRCQALHTYIHTYIHTCIHTYIHACIHTYIHAYIHTCIHTYTYIHTYIRACIDALVDRVRLYHVYISPHFDFEISGGHTAFKLRELCK